MSNSPVRSTVFILLFTGLARLAQAASGPAWTDIALELHLEDATRPDEIVTTAKPADVEQQVILAQGQLQRMQNELEAVLATPAPQPAGDAVVPQQAAPTAERKRYRVEDVPLTPVVQVTEEYANSLYALGKHKEAQATYELLLKGKSPLPQQSWYRFQSANCSRKLGDYAAAVQVYDQVTAEAGDSHWAKEAAWWAAQLKWWLLWKNETEKPATVATQGAPRAAQ